MAFVGSGLLLGGLGLAGDFMQADAAGDAARAQVKGNNASIAEQRRQFDLIMQMLQPQRQIGLNATNALNQLYGFGSLPQNAIGASPNTGSQIGSSGIGIGPNGQVTQGIRGLVGNVLGGSQQPQAGTNAMSPQAQGQPDFSGFFASPDYNFVRSEGQRDVGNSFAARGGAASGNALRALAQYNQNLAAGQYGNYFNRLADLAGMGQTATSQGVNAAQNTGVNIGNALANSGNARASGIVNRSNAYGDMFGSFAGLLGRYGG